ncbi:MAG: LPXTG cell wall anchor domain-containing protein [Aeromicrobium sp.]|uniref:LPXTG cell wall anchor domain-containing protein n=1 Tax=Aeromicrobium sp. TaxID=1871063 RepID=UPI0039E3833A
MSGSNVFADDPHGRNIVQRIVTTLLALLLGTVGGLFILSPAHADATVTIEDPEAEADGTYRIEVGGTVTAGGTGVRASGYQWVIYDPDGNRVAFCDMAADIYCDYAEFEDDETTVVPRTFGGTGTSVFDREGTWKIVLDSQIDFESEAVEIEVEPAAAEPTGTIDADAITVDGCTLTVPFTTDDYTGDITLAINYPDDDTAGPTTVTAAHDAGTAEIALDPERFIPTATTLTLATADGTELDSAPLSEDLDTSDCQTAVEPEEPTDTEEPDDTDTTDDEDTDTTTTDDADTTTTAAGILPSTGATVTAALGLLGLLGAAGGTVLLRRRRHHA